MTQKNDKSITINLFACRKQIYIQYLSVIKVILLSLFFTVFATCIVNAEDKGPTKLELTGSEHHVSKFENYADRMKGKPFDTVRFGSTAMKRVKSLYERYPNHSEVQKLFERVRMVVKRSKGDFLDITPEMLAYRKQEQNLVKEIGRMATEEWHNYQTRFQDSGRLINKPFPAPEPGVSQSEANMHMRKVILKDFVYPENEFTNTGRQYVSVGSASTGYYFIILSDRRWLGAYEALRRYRGSVKDELSKPWILAGTVVGSQILVPYSGERRASDIARFGWLIAPEVIYVKDHLFAESVPGTKLGGSFAGEDQLDALKRPYLTYTEVPTSVEPQKMVEIFATAIKEKNFELYLDCIDPIRKKGRKALSRLRYFWEDNQQRFAKYYVHVDPFEVGKIIALKGERFDDGEVADFFLTSQDKMEISSRADDLKEEVAVGIRTFDEHGKQVSLPKDVILRRYNGGRWYIYEGFPL